jgi:hypothetical protein
MGEEEVDLPRTAIEEVEAETPDPGAGVEHKVGAIVERDLDARRISPVAKGVRPRCRHRSAATPDRHAHGDCRLLAPEDRHDPDELVGMGEQREGSHGDFTIDPINARDPKSLVRRAPFVEGDSCRPPLEWQRLGGERSGLKPCRPFLQRHLTDLRKSAAKDGLRRLVEVDEPAPIVSDQCGRCEVRREFTSENENEVLLSRRSHRQSVRLPGSRIGRRVGFGKLATATIALPGGSIPERVSPVSTAQIDEPGHTGPPRAGETFG